MFIVGTFIYSYIHLTHFLRLTSIYRHLAHWRLLGDLSQTVLMTGRKPPGPQESLKKEGSGE